MKSPLLRRLAAYSGSLLLGLAGVAVLASPAQAHHTTPNGVPTCTPTEWIISWTVENWNTDMSAVIQVVDDESDPDIPITNIVDGATLPGRENGELGKLTGEQRVPLSTKSVDLTIFGKWSNNKTATNSYHVVLDAALCGQHKADLTGQAVCDQDTGNWNVSWIATNKHYTDPAKVTIINKTANPNDPNFSALEIGGAWEPITDTSVVVGLHGDVTIPGGSTVSATQVVPGNATAVRLKIRLNWATEGDTQSRVVAFEGSCVKNAPKPSATFSSDCTGVVTVTLMNAADATKAAVFEVKGAGGWSTPEKISILPGEDPVKVTVPASASSAITVLENGVKVSEYKAEEKECPSPEPSPESSPSAPPTLPKTGDNVTLFVIAGLLLVAVGFAVFMLARRRRLNLTEV